MLMGIAGIGVALVVVTLAGVVALVGLGALSNVRRVEALRPLASELLWPETAALSFVTGTGVLSLQMLFYSFAGWPFHVLRIGVPWAAVLAVVATVPAARRRAAAVLGVGAPAASSRSWSGFEIALALLVSVQVAYALFYALSFPIAGWDAWEFWFMKARIFFSRRQLSMEFPSGPAFSDYPLHMPFAVTWLYVVAGGVLDRWAKILYPLQFCSLLLAFNGFVRIMSSRIHALFFTALLAAVPLIVVQGGGLPAGVHAFGLYEWDQVGYSDLSLSLCFLLAGGLLCVGLETKRPLYFYEPYRDLRRAVNVSHATAACS